MESTFLRDVAAGGLLLLLPLLGGCGEPEATAIAAGTTAFAGHYPAHEIEQIYYLGVFDPQEQVPATVYRVRVHGQASMMSLMRFGSGWVKADLIDSLGSDVSYGKSAAGEGDGKIQITKDAEWTSSLPTGRKLVLFGPQGFREAPKGHRLVIVMGASPENFFKAFDQSLGIMTGTALQLRDQSLNQDLVKELSRLRAERDRIEAADAAVESGDAAGKGAQP